LTPVAGQRRVIAVIDDLFFLVQVQDAARREGLTVETRSDDAGIDLAASEGPAVWIIDLNARTVDAVAAIRRVKAADGAAKILAFVPHVMVERRAAAQEAGADLVVPRSRFGSELGEFLRGE
jgi:DNA-binding NarL/FixJ family response regulator